MATIKGNGSKKSRFPADNGNKTSCDDAKMKHVRHRKDREIVNVQEQNGTRELIVPSKKPLKMPAFLSQRELERLRDQAHVVTMQEKRAKCQEFEEKRNEQQKQSQKRKDQLEKAKIDQDSSNKLNKVESEAKKQSMYLLQRSYELVQEQDDRVKVANGVILATKCRAIRNAQISEKKLISQQLNDEDRRLDLMIEQQRQKALDRREIEKEQDMQKNQIYVRKLMDQIKENEVERMIEAERIEEESKLINKALIEMQRDDQKKLDAKKEAQQRMRDELNKANAEIEQYKLLQQEEERIGELRVQEFMRKKALREEAREQELLELKIAKEKEIARLRAQQEKAQDRQAAMDEMNALRVQEEVEKQWRDKEMAAAIRRKEQNEMLKVERAKQIDDIRRAQALQLAKEEQDFYKVVKIQHELYEKDVEKKKNQHVKALKHRNELLQQVNDKEVERIKQQQMKFEEGKLQVAERRVNDRHVSEYIQKKVDKLRGHNLEENYVKDIQLQLKLKKLC